MNKWSKFKLILVVCIVIAVGIALDQITKTVFEGLEKANRLPIYLFGSVGFTWAENAGGAWSIFAGSEGKNVIFFILTLAGIPLFLLLLYIGRRKSVVGILGYSAAVSGTIGNAVDRMLRGDQFFNGKVRDFLSIGDWFPVFNVADILLVGGVIFILLAILFLDDDSLVNTYKKERAEKLAAQEGNTAQDQAFADKPEAKQEQSTLLQNDNEDGDDSNQPNANK